MLIKPVSPSLDLLLLDKPVACIRRSDIHLLTARRNAWNSTMINHFRTDEPTFSSHSSARISAGTRRKRGTYFEIREVPSLVFDVDGHSLVVTHLNASPRFSSWKIPEAMADRDSVITGLDAFHMFAGSRYREAASGWQVSRGQPDVLVGLVKSAALRTSGNNGRVNLWRSSIQSGGKMTFRIAQSADAKDEHSARIIEELGHLTHQKYPVHEIYRWRGEYLCREDVWTVYFKDWERQRAKDLPVRLTVPPEPSAFCSVCLRGFSGACSADVE